MSFTVGGILHRFPKLRVALPRGRTRLAAVLARAPRRALGADARAGAEHRPQAERVLPLGPLLHRLRPGRERRSPHVVELLGEDVVVYASDYCHWDCTFPDTVKIIAERTDLSAQREEADLRRQPGAGSTALGLSRRAASISTALLDAVAARRSCMMECQEGIIGGGGRARRARRGGARATARSRRSRACSRRRARRGVPVFYLHRWRAAPTAAAPPPTACCSRSAARARRCCPARRSRRRGRALAPARRRLRRHPLPRRHAVPRHRARPAAAQPRRAHRRRHRRVGQHRHHRAHASRR